MRLLIHTQFYPPEMGAPPTRLFDLARRLRHLGHEVQVLTALPNYPTGRIFQGYPQRYHREEMKGILVHRCWILPSNGPGLAHRLLSYLSFSLSSLWVGLTRTARHDVILTESPPLFLAVAGWVLARLKGARWILNVSDLWPDTAKDIGKLSDRSVTYRILQRLAHFLYRRAWWVTGQSREIVSEIRTYVPSARVYHLSNGVDTELFHPAKASQEIRRLYLKPGEVGCVYAGLHGLCQGLEQVIAAARLVEEEGIRIILIGDGPEKGALLKSARDQRLSNVAFYPPISQEQITSILASMDAALIVLKSHIRGAVPSKIYEAMASGVPIILAADGEAASIVRKTGAGVAVSPGDTEELATALRQIAADSSLRKSMGQAGRRAAERLYNRRQIAERFGNLLQSAE